MNITEANHANTLLRYLLNEPDVMGRVPTADEARAAAVALADRSRRALGAGLSGADVDALWDDLELPGCWPDDWRSDYRPYDDVVSDRLVDPDGPQTPSEYRRNRPLDCTDYLPGRPGPDREETA
jgi:hypothetical protein